MKLFLLDNEKVGTLRPSGFSFFFLSEPKRSFQIIERGERAVEGKERSVLRTQWWRCVILIENQGTKYDFMLLFSFIFGNSVIQIQSVFCLVLAGKEMKTRLMESEVTNGPRAQHV